MSPARAAVREYRVCLTEKRHWWAWPLMPFLHELSKLITSCLPPRNNLQNIFSYLDEEVRGTRWVSPEVGKTISIYNWICFLIANLWFILLNQCQLQFFYTVPSTYGGQSSDLLFALDSVSIDWISSCVPLNLIPTWLLSIWTTTRQRAAGGTAGQMWMCEKGQGPASLSLQHSLKFLPTLLLLSLATLVCCRQGEGLLVTLVFVLNC